MKFKKLSARAKEHARDEYRGGGYLDWDWWEFGDLVECARLLGIEFDERPGRQGGGPKIYFDIGCQGAGACFEGSYAPPKNMMGILEHAPKDKVLKNLAERLIALQIRAKLEFEDEVGAKTVTRRNDDYMETTVFSIAERACGNHQTAEVTLEEEKEMTAILGAFADWMHHELEAQYEYLMSDECVDQYLEEMEFDEDGDEV